MRIPRALPKFGVPGPTARTVTVAEPLSSLRVISGRHGVIALVAPVVVTVLVVSVVTAPNVVYSAVNDSLSNVSMMSCAMTVASVIVLPVFSWRPPRMNIEQMESSTPARTPMAMTTSIRLKPCSPPPRVVMVLPILMSVSSSLEGAVGGRARPRGRHGDGVAVVARVVDHAAYRQGLVPERSGRAVDIEGDRRGARAFDVHAVQANRDPGALVIDVGVLVRRPGVLVADRHGALRARRDRVVAQGPQIGHQVVVDAPHLVRPERVVERGPAEDDEQPHQGDDDQELREREPRFPSVLPRLHPSFVHRLSPARRSTGAAHLASSK